ncbi:hypothetical protein KM043_012348 [Ampulex compressa]|nr:hypothetical protein KM043_012348 [Ampulex compressa]
MWEHVYAAINTRSEFPGCAITAGPFETRGDARRTRVPVEGFAVQGAERGEGVEGAPRVRELAGAKTMERFQTEVVKHRSGARRTCPSARRALPRVERRAEERRPRAGRGGGQRPKADPAAMVGRPRGGASVGKQKLGCAAPGCQGR